MTNTPSNPAMKKSTSKELQALPINLVESLSAQNQPLNTSPLSSESVGKLLQELDYARHIATATPDLSEAERKLFQQNCAIIRQAKIALVIRNNAILQVYEGAQWREHYDSVEEFANQYAGMSKSQLFKCVDEARVIEVFGRENLISCVPTGRHVEKLVKVPQGHWISAWTYALEQCEEDGLSEKRVEFALHDYCRDRKISFGRQKSNGKGGTYTSLMLPVPRYTAEDLPPLKDAIESWVGNLSSEQEKKICDVIPVSVFRDIETAFKTKRPVELILETALQTNSGKKISEEEIEGVSMVLELIRENDPVAYREVTLEALIGFRERHLTKLRQRCRKNQKGRMDYSEKKAARRHQYKES